MKNIVEKPENNTSMYDFSGLNKKFANALKNGYSQTEIDTANKYADYWYSLGFDVIPCDSAKKGMWILKKYVHYYEESIPDGFHEHWKKVGAFTYGITMILGEIRRGKNKGKFINGIDWDNQLGEKLLLSITSKEMNLAYLAAMTIVEKHKGSPQKGHAYFITPRPLINRESDKSSTNTVLSEKIERNEIPALEVFGGKHPMIVTNSYKPDEAKNRRDLTINRSKIVGTRIPLELNDLQTDEFENAMDTNLKKYGLEYLSRAKNGSSQKPIEELFKEDYRVYEGDNRQLNVLRIAASLIKRLNPIMTLDDIKEIVIIWNNKHCIPPLSDKERDTKFNEAVKKIALRTDQQEVISELEELGISPDKYVNEENLPQYVKDLKQMIKKKSFDVDNPNDIDNLAEALMEKFDFKAMRDIKELYHYDGKVCAKYGEQKILQELERMQDEQRPKVKKLSELTSKVDETFTECNNANKNTNELLKYQYVLGNTLHEEEGKELKVRNALVSEVVQKIVRKNFIDREAFTVDPNRIILENGNLILSRKKIKVKDKDIESESEDLSWTLREHSPKVLVLNKFPVKYNPRATCPNFINALLQICKYNKTLYVNIIKMLGYCIYQSCEFQCAFMLWGDGDNMKSVILKAITSLLGKENVCSVSLHDLCDGDKFYPAQLFGKTANIYADLPFNKIHNTSKFKAAIAGDLIDGQFKNQPIFNFEPYAKQIYSTNRISKSDDDTYGWFKRWVLLHFKIRIPKHLQDRQLITKITTPEELSGILNLALGGLKLLIRDGGFETGSLASIKKEYEKQSSLVKEFVMQGYHLDAGNESREYCVQTEQVQEDFINFLGEDEGERLQYVQSELVNSGVKDRGISLNNKMDRWIAIGLLGRELAAMGIDNKQKLDGNTGTRPHYYLGLKPRTGIDGKPLDEFQKSGIIN